MKGASHKIRILSATALAQGEEWWCEFPGGWLVRRLGLVLRPAVGLALIAALFGGVSLQAAAASPPEFEEAFREAYDELLKQGVSNAVRLATCAAVIASNPARATRKQETPPGNTDRGTTDSSRSSPGSQGANKSNQEDPGLTDRRSSGLAEEGSHRPYLSKSGCWAIHCARSPGPGSLARATISRAVFPTRSRATIIPAPRPLSGRAT